MGMADKNFGKRAEMGHMMRGEETMAPRWQALAKYTGNIIQGRYSLFPQWRPVWLTHAEDTENTLADTF